MVSKKQALDTHYLAMKELERSLRHIKTDENPILDSLRTEASQILRESRMLPLDDEFFTMDMATFIEYYDLSIDFISVFSEQLARTLRRNYPVSIETLPQVLDGLTDADSVSDMIQGFSVEELATLTVEQKLYALRTVVQSSFVFNEKEAVLVKLTKAVTADQKYGFINALLANSAATLSALLAKVQGRERTALLQALGEVLCIQGSPNRIQSELHKLVRDNTKAGQLSAEQRAFAVLILGHTFQGKTIEYTKIKVEENVVPTPILEKLSRTITLTEAEKTQMIADIQDPTRGTSLPGTVYLPGRTKSDLPRVAHEVFHQIQYRSIPNVLDTLISEQKKASLAGKDVYDYLTLNTGHIRTLSDITTTEAQANYVEDFAKDYQAEKIKMKDSAQTQKIWRRCFLILAWILRQCGRCYETVCSLCSFISYSDLSNICGIPKV